VTCGWAGIPARPLLCGRRTAFCGSTGQDPSGLRPSATAWVCLTRSGVAPLLGCLVGCLRLGPLSDDRGAPALRPMLCTVPHPLHIRNRAPVPGPFNARFTQAEWGMTFLVARCLAGVVGKGGPGKGPGGAAPGCRLLTVVARCPNADAPVPITGGPSPRSTPRR
jgi:hypothetical protein